MNGLCSDGLIYHAVNSYCSGAALDCSTQFTGMDWTAYLDFISDAFLQAQLFKIADLFFFSEQ